MKLKMICMLEYTLYGLPAHETVKAWYENP